MIPTGGPTGGSTKGLLTKPIEVVLTVVAFAALRSIGAIANMPLPAYLAMLVLGAGTNALVQRRSTPACSTRQVHLHVFTNVAATTTVMYATGWGPTLALGYVWVGTDALNHFGSRCIRPVLEWSLVGIVCGQLAIAVGLAPSFIDEPAVYGLAVLAALGLTFTFYMAGVTTAQKERAELDVRRSEERFRSLVQNSSDIVAVVGQDGARLYVTPSVEQLGYSPDEFLTGAPPVHPDDRARAAGAFRKALASPRVAVSAELRLQHADGSWRWNEATLTNRIDDPTIAGIVVNFHDITERKTFEAQLTHAAYHDRLTGLMNRGRFVERLEQTAVRAARVDASTAVLFVDLDRFKMVNDTLGHEIGDAILRDVADRLRASVRAEDVVGRYGGDEFTVLAPDTDRDGARALAERVTTMLRDPYRVRGRELVVTASVGLVVAESRFTSDELLARADLAMYLAKENGRSRWELFDPEMGSSILDGYRTASELRQAIDGDQLVTVFQPEISLATGALVGVEALVRWRHPERGMLLPIEFIPAAEEHGIIRSIDRYVMETACRQLQSFRTMTVDGVTPSMSVNLSPDSLTDDGIAALVDIVDSSGIDPTALQVEVTERTAVAAWASLSTVEALRDRGVRVVVDDFGTGHSSLSRLQEFAFDGLKIDRHFIADLDVTPTATAIVQAVVNLGHELGLRLTAEGVESKGQLDRLRNLGCDSAQGFYFAPPLPVDALTELIERSPTPLRSRPAEPVCNRTA